MQRASLLDCCAVIEVCNIKRRFLLAAKHLIQYQSKFVDTIKSSVCLAESGKLVTCGVVPDNANVDYGYLRLGKPCRQGYEVDKFI